jgi:hypothetical protein
VKLAEEAAVLGARDAPALRERLDVIELDAAGGSTDAAVVHLPLALALVPFPDRTAKVGGDGASAVTLGKGRRHLGCGAVRLLSRVLHEPAPLGVALVDEIEPDLDDRVGACARVRM